uniref:Organic solute carrier partner 1 n=1 Tax=Chromera velia CCMP2878 TaxID=1169474 RepID=A0A0G4HF21_9ALVE|eukprot:Cvel_26927.t1-p1 / transcript=Cvel_26927.t1 / gene=Cvel_26927 / organism=Chromera_velia_CCMP2878 / gene_product=Protein OSCP1, putative / transcript_product=Protein OSCP1, putative / location=Cvel_scaffold3278:2365-3699(-) / protein_length=445 / sequence_SO=supercontig / SO=protein_coding / is_pseudo=false
MSGALYAMPIIVLNMGGEMLYVLQQRLEAQNVPMSKQESVLQEVIRTMHFNGFIQELFRPQPIYSMSSTRQIFDRLAHSSVMRLNEASMDKLFDLMTMGVKSQILRCNRPEEMLELTLNHLNWMRAFVGECAPSVQMMVDGTIRLVHERYASLTAGEFMLLRQSVCLFFQDRFAKVSLLLQSGQQRPDGTLVVSKEGPLPYGAERPGLIRYLQGGIVVRQQTVPTEGSSRWTPSVASSRISLVRYSKLGLNIYSKDAPQLPHGQSGRIPANQKPSAQSQAVSLTLGGVLSGSSSAIGCLPGADSEGDLPGGGSPTGGDEGGKKLGVDGGNALLASLSLTKSLKIVEAQKGGGAGGGVPSPSYPAGGNEGEHRGPPRNSPSASSLSRLLERDRAAAAGGEGISPPRGQGAGGGAVGAGGDGKGEKEKEKTAAKAPRDAVVDLLDSL